MIIERPCPVVGTQLPQSRACRPQRAQHPTAPDYQLHVIIDFRLFERNDRNMGRCI